MAGKTEPNESLYLSAVANAAYIAENPADKRAGMPCKLLTPHVSCIRNFDVRMGCKYRIIFFVHQIE